MSGRRLRRAPRGVSVTHWSSPESYVWLHLSHKVPVWPAEARNTLLGDGPHLYCLCLCLLSGRSLHLIVVVVAVLARIYHIEHGNQPHTYYGRILQIVSKSFAFCHHTAHSAWGSGFAETEFRLSLPRGRRLRDGRTQGQRNGAPNTRW